MARIAIFAVVTLALAYVSRRSLGSPALHGFHRFFAWEAILALLLLNFVDFGQWFGDPLSARQIASWILLVGSLIVFVQGPGKRNLLRV